MKKIFIFLTLISLFACKQQPMESGAANIIPRPQKLEITPGFFQINQKTSLIVPKDSLGFAEATYFSDFFSNASGIHLAVRCGEPEDHAIILRINNTDSLAQEAYQMHVNGDRLMIEAASTTGLFYGIQSLLQLLPVEAYSSKPTGNMEWKVPCCKIKDQPRFSWRGMHLDVSRHFFPKEFILKYIDLIAMHKMNVFHWHLTDDNGWRLEIKKYPKLTSIAAWHVDRQDEPWREVRPPKPNEKSTYGGFYTQDDVKEIVAYASARHITIIPEIEMPGHSSEVFAAYPQLSCEAKTLYVQPGSYWPNEDIFCAGNDSVFVFLENVLDEVSDLFPSKYIHIGGDEANKTKWEACPKCQKRMQDEHLKDEHELQSWFIKRIEKYITSKGRKMIGWDEILEGGLAPEATVMSWRGMQGGIEAAKMNHDVVMSPTTYCYFDYYQADPDFEPEAIGGFLPLKKVYAFEPVPEELTEQEASHILGAQANLWSEFVASTEHAEYMVLPRMTALAEVIWSPKEDRDWEDFQQRLQFQLERFQQAGYNYSKGSWRVNIQADFSADTFRVSLSSEQYDKPIYYTINGSEPSLSSIKYEKPFAITESSNIEAAIFDGNELKEKPVEKNIVFHKALGNSVTCVHQASQRYPARGVSSLTDGLRGGHSYRDGYWMGFHGDDLDCTIDLGQQTTVSRVEAGFLQNSGNWIFLPKKIRIQLLDTSKNILEEVIVFPEATPEAKGLIIENLQAEFNSISARYVRIWAKNIRHLPRWHEGAGQAGWLFVDELVVE